MQQIIESAKNLNALALTGRVAPQVERDNIREVIELPYYLLDDERRPYRHSNPAAWQPQPHKS